MKRTQMISNDVANKSFTITDALSELRRKEYKLELRREATHLYCNELHQWIMPENFTVDESYYFEKIESPDADGMLYAISLSQGVKGFLLDACTVYTDNISPEMMKKLRWSRILSANDPINGCNEDGS
jgi:hypothetical protein